MIRSALFSASMLFVLAGCVNKPKESTSFKPAIAAQIGLVSTSKVTPTPEPSPEPAGKCANCKGKGRLGDGTVSVPCPVCGGDGRTDNDLPKTKSPDCTCKDCDCVDCKCKKPAVVYVPLVEKPAPVKAAPPVMQDCPSGMCGPQASQSTQTTAEESYEQPRQRRGLFGRRRGR